MKHRWLVLFVAVVAAVTVAGCGGRKEGGKGDKPSKKIGYSSMTRANPFFIVIENTMKEEGAKVGFDVQTLDAKNDVEVQSQHIDNFISDGVDVIVVNPTDRIAIGPAIKRANEAGIPVFTCDLQCVADGVKIAGHVGTDNLQGGRLAGQAMIDALGEAGGKVLVLHFKQANSCVLRVQGFTEVIDAHNAGRDSGKIEIVSVLEGGANQDDSQKAASAALQTHKDLAGIFAINDPSALGAWNSLDQAKRTADVVIVGFDGELAGKQAIKDGKFYADPIQFPKKMGQRTIENIVKYFNGEKFADVELFATELYTKEDADQDPELK